MVWVDDVCQHHDEEMSEDELINQSREFFKVCERRNALLNPEKCYVYLAEYEYIGYEFNQLGSKITDKYRNKILDFEKPRNVKELQDFLGTIQYINRYIHQCQILTYWLNDLIKGIASNGKNVLQWTPQANLAFEEIKKSIRRYRIASL